MGTAAFGDAEGVAAAPSADDVALALRPLTHGGRSLRQCLTSGGYVDDVVSPYEGQVDLPDTLLVDQLLRVLKDQVEMGIVAVQDSSELPPRLKLHDDGTVYALVEPLERLNHGYNRRKSGPYLKMS